MEIICLTVGSLQTNCYLVVDRQTQKTLIIDPADEADFISTTILEKKLIPEAILLTHGHYDHCLGALELKLNFNLPIYLHPADLSLYNNAHSSATFWSKSQNKTVIPDMSLDPEYFSGIRNPSPILKLPPINSYLIDNQIITFGNSSLQVIHTAGHTQGSCCFLSVCHSGLDPESSSPSQSLFTGDTLFASGVGSTNHLYSSKSDLQKSLTRLKSIIQSQKSLLIYPAHEDYGFSLTSISQNTASTYKVSP